MDSILIERNGKILLSGVQEPLPEALSGWIAIRPGSTSGVRFYIRRADITAVYDLKGGITRFCQAGPMQTAACERNCLVRVRGGVSYLGDRHHIPAEMELAGDRADRSIFLWIGTGENMIVRIPEDEIERLYSI
jgi:hypothetical protein